ncbi:MAG: zf-HC2 domain-containing protein [Oscillospiraceae bacterium]|nr:zf-HC2 domain-containing protein [Oscillospiraceae bacterium]
MIASCDIVKDLLPLYLDGVCSGDSKAAVDEHIASCEKCNAELKTLQKEIPIDCTEQNLKEAEAVMGLARRWRKGMTKSLLKGIFITILSVAAVLLVLYLFMDIRIVY